MDPLSEPHCSLSETYSPPKSKIKQQFLARRVSVKSRTVSEFCPPKLELLVLDSIPTSSCRCREVRILEILPSHGKTPNLPKCCFWRLGILQDGKETLMPPSFAWLERTLGCRPLPVWKLARSYLILRCWVIAAESNLKASLGACTLIFILQILTTVC